MSGKALSFFLAGLLVAAGLAIPFLLNRTAPPEDFGAGPRIELTDQNGNKFDSDAHRGKALLVNFFFSSCGGECPALNGRVAMLYRRFKADPNLEFVSISVDPETDTPPILLKYSARFLADTSRWHFLTGTREQVRAILDSGLHLVHSDDLSLHTTRVVLLDANRRIRGYYQGSDDQFVDKAAADISAITNY